MKPADVVVGVLAGAVESKVRPGIVIASETYLRERPDVLVGILTTKIPIHAGFTDCVLEDCGPQGSVQNPAFVRSY